MGMSGEVRYTVADINVTPLIDVLLVLLIIFMVIVPVTPRGMQSNIPQPPKRNQPEAPANIVVQVLANGVGEPVYRINETAFPKEQIESQLAAIFASRQDKAMFVKADNSLEFSRIAEVIDMGHQASVDSIGLLPPGFVNAR